MYKERGDDMKICVLDAKTLGNISLAAFEKFGQVIIYDITSPDEIQSRIDDVDIIITNKIQLNETNLCRAKNLKLICITATGTNNVDLEYAAKNNIAVTNVAGYSTHSVVQHTFAMLFYLLEQLKYYDEYIKSGAYTNSKTFTFISREFWEIRDKTWGIVGMGAIGKAVAKIAEAFGAKVIYYSTSGKNTDAGYKQVSLEELLTESDIISIHAPLNENTKNLFTYKEMSQMKETAILINVGRGAIINEEDLTKILNENKIAAASLDVLEHEPMEADNPLLNVKDGSKLLITPHIAWASIEARTLLIEEVALNIDAFVTEEKRNRVDLSFRSNHGI